MGDHRGYERLRAELLTSGSSDWVSLAEVQQIISHFQLAETDAERQDAELRDATGQRIDPNGNPVTRRSPGNHMPIVWDW
jgi:hypothetical protein